MRRLFLVLCISLIGAISVFAEDGIPDNCENPNSPYASTNTFARFSNSTKQLWLVDWSTGDQLQLVDQFEGDLRIINWSPDCRYLAVNEGVLNRPPTTNEDGSVDNVFWPWYSDPQIYIYDITTNQRVYTGIGPSSWRITFVEWSPDSRRALISTQGFRTFFWNADTGQTQQVYYYPDAEGSYVPQLFWDQARGWLWSNWAGARAYNADTGTEIASYRHYTLYNTIYPQGAHANFIFSPDSQYVALYSQTSYEPVPGITVYNINQPDNPLILNVEGNGG
ncbi:MAG: WD40 repeat domain-containing protein, partial [Anaerolineae bacterium]|nr:WD40 repeat domain-containing protein [Anaerolineae bacterium]